MKQALGRLQHLVRPALCGLAPCPGAWPFLDFVIIHLFPKRHAQRPFNAAPLVTNPNRGLAYAFRCWICARTPFPTGLLLVAPIPAKLFCSGSTGCSGKKQCRTFLKKQLAVGFICFGAVISLAITLFVIFEQPPKLIIKRMAVMPHPPTKFIDRTDDGADHHHVVQCR